MKNIIIKIEKDSIAEEMGIKPGDMILSINGKNILDVFDYRYLIKDEYVEVLILTCADEQILFEIEKDEDEDLGIHFETGLMDNSLRCKNNCIFCFIDQLPKNMRTTLYFKDDDSRLSFLQGNYVTLTNMNDEELKRIIFYHLSPINISVHTTNPSLRKQMLKNPASEKIMEQIQMLYDAGIEMNFQVVLCKNINDGHNLGKTIEDLSRFIPKGKSLSVVPVGISKYREKNKLFLLEPFTKDDCLNIIKQLEKWNIVFKQKHGINFVYPADEFFVKAQMTPFNHEYYDGFPQIENGVGMISLFKQEFITALRKTKKKSKNKKITIVTGYCAYDFIKGLAILFNKKYSNIQINIIAVRNNFFGENITVSGLLTGVDILEHLKGQDLGCKVLIPENSLKSGETVFLDDYTLNKLATELDITINIVEVSGQQLLNEILQ